MSEVTDDLLQALISLVGRSVFDQEHPLQVVNPPHTKGRQLLAYNLCDGTMTQSEIIKRAKLDPGNFSRTVTQWIEAGFLFRIGKGREAKLLHVYPLSSGGRKSKGTTKKT